jgi:hypothetical protein
MIHLTMPRPPRLIVSADAVISRSLIDDGWGMQEMRETLVFTGESIDTEVNKALTLGNRR